MCDRNKSSSKMTNSSIGRFVTSGLRGLDIMHDVCTVKYLCRNTYLYRHVDVVAD